MPPPSQKKKDTEHYIETVRVYVYLVFGNEGTHKIVHYILGLC